MDFRISLVAKQVAYTLLKIVIGLVLLSLLGRLILAFLPKIPGLGLFTREFYLDEEANFPSVYSSLALLLAAGILYVIGRFEARVQSLYSRHWKILSGIFVYLSIDELTSIHEHANELRKAGLHGIFYYAWVIPAAVLMVVFVAAFTKFLLHLDRKTRLRMMFSGGLFLLGAIGFEMLGSGIEERLGEEGVHLDPLYQFFMTTEESCEMTGIICFIHTLLRYLNQRHGVRELVLGFSRQFPGMPPDRLIPVDTSLDSKLVKVLPGEHP
jgi:hypothetical protein